MNSRTPIKALLNEHVGGFERARSKRIIHASDLTKEDLEYCPREHILMKLERVEQKDPYVNTALRVTWDDGVDKQARVNNQYLKDFMVGDWICRSCGKLYEWRKGPPPRHGECRCPNGSLWEYSEVVFRHKKNKASGSVDALVDIGKAKLRACEVKIMATSMFPPKLPLAEHTLRTRLYLWLIANSDHPRKNRINTRKASVLYLCRGHGKKDEDGVVSPFREFTVERNDSDIKHLGAKAMALTKARTNTRKFMPFGVCPTSDCGRAKACRVSKPCFSGDYKGNLTWMDDGSPVHAKAKWVAKSGSVSKNCN